MSTRDVMYDMKHLANTSAKDMGKLLEKYWVLGNDFFFNLFLNGVYLLYHVVLVSAIQQHEPASNDDF